MRHITLLSFLLLMPCFSTSNPLESKYFCHVYAHTDISMWAIGILESTIINLVELFSARNWSVYRQGAGEMWGICDCLEQDGR